MVKLTSEPRAKLTDRQCASILGGIIGCLCENSDVETVRNAVKWWSENEIAWEAVNKYVKTNKQVS